MVRSVDFDQHLIATVLGVVATYTAAAAAAAAGCTAANKIIHKGRGSMALVVHAAIKHKRKEIGTSSIALTIW
jgi:hypothetical protein